MSNSITLSALESALTGSAAAFRSITKLQPVGGEGDKVFPSTYAGGVYATEKRRLPGESDYVECVLLNSVQSEANHAELALRQAISRGEIHLPLIEADFTGCNHKFRKPVPNLTSLEVPHRLADAILRDCALPDGVRFSQSDYARNWSRANLWNATPIFEICPTALVFGMWGSPDKPGGLGAKFERAYVSEIVAIDAIQNPKRAGFRIDPLESSKNVLLKKTDDGFQLADPKAKGAIRPSEMNHGNIPYDTSNAGIRCRYAEQTTVVSLGALRKLQFPISGKQSAGQDNAARTVLAAIGLCAGVLAAERGTSLRSRCHLVPVETRVWRLVDIPGRPQTEFEVTAAQAVALLNEAVAAAKAAGLPWMEEMLTLTPTPELVQLIQQSQEVMAKEPGEGD